MRRILIDNDVRALASAYLQDLLNRKTTKWKKNEMPRKRLQMIYDGLIPENAHLKCYISQLIGLYEKIILLESEYFDSFHATYFSAWDDDMDTPVKVKKKEMPFSEAIQWALRYDNLRTDLIPDHIKSLHINACVYCNETSVAPSGTYIEKGKKKKNTRYQVDHYFPQSKYPYLCTSFYNLQPSCASCNNKKSDNKSLFNLYTLSTDKQDTFSFSIGSDDQILNALISRDPNILEIHLTSNEKELRVNHEKLFHVESLYQESHRKDALRVMGILMKNNNSYIESVKEALGTVVTKTEWNIIDDYFSIFGYDMHKNMVHNKPLNKLAQDIVEFYELPIS